MLAMPNSLNYNNRSDSVNHIIDDVTEKLQFFGYIIGVIYVAVVFLIQKWMKTRSKFELKNFAIFWNIFMMVLNAVATCGLLPTLVHISSYQDFYSSLCVDKTCNNDSYCGFWLRAFPYMKIIELGDTILLVLQKRKLVTYYWCHHLGALLITWYIYPSYPPAIILWCAVMINLSHVFIYMYGVARSLGYSVSQIVPASLLVSEILQMVIGGTLCFFVYYYIIIGRYCDISILNISILCFMYLFCFVLCVILFYKRFYARKVVTKGKSVSTLTSVITG